MLIKISLNFIYHTLCCWLAILMLLTTKMPTVQGHGEHAAAQEGRLSRANNKDFSSIKKQIKANNIFGREALRGVKFQKTTPGPYSLQIPKPKIHIEKQIEQDNGQWYEKKANNKNTKLWENGKRKIKQGFRINSRMTRFPLEDEITNQIEATAQRKSMHQNINNNNFNKNMNSYSLLEKIYGKGENNLKLKVKTNYKVNGNSKEKQHRQALTYATNSTI